MEYYVGYHFKTSEDIMINILIRAGSFIAIIILGYVLRRVGFFKEEDFNVLSKIVLKITLPAAIITSFSGKTIELGMLSILLVGLGSGLLYMGLGYLINLKNGKRAQAFGILNLSGYNIGNFTMPFVQNFLGPIGVIATSVLDVGNAIVCLGGAYSVASIVQGNGSFSAKKIVRTLTSSIAFDCYIVMIVMSIARIPIPNAVVSLSEIIGNANAFISMLMLGVGFHISGDLKQKGVIIKYLILRYGVAIVLALGCYFLLPFSLEIRQALVILMFAPIASAVPAFTKELDGDVGLSSAINSISIVCSIVLIVAILLIFL